MNYLNIAGIKHGSEEDLQNILSHRVEIQKMFLAAVKSCAKYGTSMPVNMQKKGNLMLAKPESTQALMIFLRACARSEGIAIRCRKRGIVKEGGKQTTQSLYCLLI